MSGVQFEIKVIGNGAETEVKNVKVGFDEAGKSVNNLNSNITKLGQAAFNINNINAAIQGVAQEFNNAIAPGIAFNSSLTDLKAITGATDAQLELIGASARQNAMDFGTDAAGGVESYKLLLSQLTPELAKAPDALAAMGRNASILAKQLKGDTAGATEILTTAMNQYGVSLEDPIAATRTMTDMMNIMSAGAKEGSAELPAIKSAIEQAGMMAKTANVPFNELNAAIQVLDKSGKKGAEGGVALRNIMAELSQGEFMPKRNIDMLKAAGVDVDALSDKSRSFSSRLKELTPIVNDTAAMTLLFGKENVAAGIAAVNGADDIAKLTTEITGTNTAVEMADTVMGSFSERMARTNAWLKDMGISLFNATSGFVPFIQIGMGALQTMSNLSGAVQAYTIISQTAFVKSIGVAVTGMVTWIGSLVSATAAQWGLNIAMDANPIGLIVIGVAALAAGFVWAWQKVEWFRGGLMGIWEVIKETGRIIADVFGAAWHVIHGVFTLDVDEIKAGYAQGAAALGNAGQRAGAAFQQGYNDGAAAVKENEKSGTSPAAKDLTAKYENDMLEAFKAAHNGESPEAWSIKNPGGDNGKAKGKGRGASSTNETASNITSGGARPNNYSIVIHKLQDQTVIHTTNIDAGGKQAGDKILEYILTALNRVGGQIQPS